MLGGNVAKVRSASVVVVFAADLGEASTFTRSLPSLVMAEPLHLVPKLRELERQNGMRPEQLASLEPAVRVHVRGICKDTMLMRFSRTLRLVPR
jgi:hypothetical protein